MYIYRRNKKVLSELYKKNYYVSRIFITYETQKQKEYCLEQLKVSKFDSIFNYYHNGYRRFNNSVILDIQQPPEPDVILWKNLKVNNDDDGDDDKIVMMMMMMGMMIRSL